MVAPRLLRLSLATCGLCLALLLLALAVGRMLPTDRIIFLSGQNASARLFGMDIARGLSHKLHDVEIGWSYYLISPDGQHILYAETVDTQPAVFVMDFNGDNRHQLFDQPIVNPAWSPDSRYIVFFRRGQDNHPTRFYRVRADGSDLILLAELPEEVQPLAAFWSPDGRQILFQVALPQIKIGLYIMDADGTDPHPYALPVSFDRLLHPTWSPDGRSIAFVGENLNSALSLASTLCVAEVATTVTHCSDSNIYDDISWSPDSASIAFIVTRGYNIYEIRILDVLTAQIRSIQRYGKTADARDVGDPVWTPDGQHLIYVLSQPRNREADRQIYIINMDGSGERRLTSGASTHTLPRLWTGE